MLIPSSILSASRSRLDFDPVQRRRDIVGKSAIEVNSPERVTQWLATAAPERVQDEGVGLERIIGGNDLMQVNYLDRGVDAARPVGRISIGDPGTGQLAGYGTGFMVSPRLLLTNNHVLPDSATAGKSFVRFNYQLDRDGNKTNADDFDLDPAACFITSTQLDFTVVAVKEKNDNGVPLSKYAWLHLNATKGKTLDAQFLSIVQHPSGERKQIAIRENQLLKTLDDFLWYVTDTAPGSSGSCVFNDAWQVVALHHSGVPATNEQGQWLAVDGSVWTPAMGDDKVKWMANEGVRISSIIAELGKYAAQPLVKELLGSMAAMPAPPAESTLVRVTPGPQTAAAQAVSSVMAEERISIDPNYDDRQGYDPAFLGTGNKRLPLPKLSLGMMQLVPDKLVDDNHPAHVLAYHHYSLVMNKVRKLPFFTAVNIDGSVTYRIKRDPDKWIYDPRIDETAQVGNELYVDNDFDRGHLVRRLDPAWGPSQDIAKVANDDTFHFTNCSPQHKKFNEGTNLWAGLENYILDNAASNEMKLTVITGPVFRDDDELYRNLIKVPKEFWKVVVIAKDGGLSATAYLVSQKNLIAGMREEFEFGPYRTFQVPVKQIADLTGLDFGKLVAADPLAAETTREAARTGLLIEAYSNLVL